MDDKENQPQNPIPHYFIMIPTHIMDDPRVDDSTAILFGRIMSLTSKKGYCFASNKYLADLTNVTEREIKYRLNCLEKCGYITKHTEKRGMHWDRKIFVNLNVDKSKILDDSNKDYEGNQCSPRREQVFPSEGNQCSPYKDKMINKINDYDYESGDPDGKKDIHYQTLKNERCVITEDEIKVELEDYGEGVIEEVMKNVRQRKPRVSNIVAYLRRCAENLLNLKRKERKNGNGGKRKDLSRSDSGRKGCYLNGKFIDWTPGDAIRDRISNGLSALP